MENMGVFTGIMELNPIAEFVVALLEVGVLLYLRRPWLLEVISQLLQKSQQDKI